MVFMMCDNFLEGGVVVRILSLSKMCGFFLASVLHGAGVLALVVLLLPLFPSVSTSDSALFLFIVAFFSFSFSFLSFSSGGFTGGAISPMLSFNAKRIDDIL